MDTFKDDHPPGNANSDHYFSAQRFSAVLADLGLEQNEAVNELRKLAEYLASRPGFNPALPELCTLAGEPPGKTAQSIQSAAEAGINNLAARCNRNAGDPLPALYTGKLFRPWQMELAKQHLKDGIEPRGRPSARYFLRGFADLCTVSVC